MSVANPFQIPSCFQVDDERRRRERFKKTFIAGVAAGVLLMVSLLIAGSMNQHLRAAGMTAMMTGSQAAPSTLPAVAATPSPVSTPEPNSPSVVSQSAPAVSKANTSFAGHSETDYVVKSGDNLTRIARTHGTTVKAIRAANGLTDDRIAAGAKLKIPQA